MRFKKYFELMTEQADNVPIIVVDVQPEYARYNGSHHMETMRKIIQFVNESTAPVLMYVNAEDSGVSSDTIYDIQEFWMENGFERDWNEVEFIDKGYGHLRGWMDQGVSDEGIISAIRIMSQQKINDSRDFEGSWEDAIDEEVPEDDPIGIHWFEIHKLQNYEGGYLIGGGGNECLKEVELMMKAFNFPFKKINSLIYW